MTAVFVHGNPETEAIWGPLLAELARTDTVCLSPPGFGAPVPVGFGATRQEYVDWLVAELERLGGDPVDLVGHDWGGGHVAGVAIERPDLLRTWCTDIAGAFQPDYVWHDFAQIWQTPGAGEEYVEATLATAQAERVARYVAIGIPEAVATEMAAAFDADMGRCILALYRDAAQPAMAELGQRLGDAKARPGLVVVASEDHFTGGEERARRSAASAGAKVARLDGLGHWWMLQDPAAGAAMLDSFWKDPNG